MFWLAMSMFEYLAVAEKAATVGSARVAGIGQI